MTQKKITIYDIAKEAQVSASTVSRVLDNHPSVKPEKRERVMKVVKKYQFRPNALAKGLSSAHSRMIGMLCPDVCNPFFSSIFSACEQAAFAAGYTLMLNNTFAQPEKEIAYMHKLMEQQAESLILCGGVADWRPLPEEYANTVRQCAQNLPVVSAGALPVERCYQIPLDHYDGMRQAVNYLASLGHTRIAFLHGLRCILQTQEKMRAFYETMAALKLHVHKEYVVEVMTFDEQGGYHGMMQLMSLPKPPTAVIAINDMTAIGAQQAILHKGYSVPKDFSLIGFDNTYLTYLVQPHLTSLSLDYQAYARTLIGAAVSAISGEQPKPLEVIPLTLHVKESCRRIFPLEEK